MTHDLLHASAVALAPDRRAVLLRGPSGAGKSDLALRLVHDGGLLVADDYVEARRHRDRIMVRAPENIRGLIEVRGIGVLRLDTARLIPEASLALIVDLLPADTWPDRLPDEAFDEVLGLPVRRIALNAAEFSASAKIFAAMACPLVTSVP